MLARLRQLPAPQRNTAADQLAGASTWTLVLAVLPALAALVATLTGTDGDTLATIVQWTGVTLTGLFLLLAASAWALARWLRTTDPTSDPATDPTSQRP